MINVYFWIAPNPYTSSDLYNSEKRQNSYRPISLLSVDYKLLARALAVCIETIHSIIFVDQMGFIKYRHAFSNIRHLLNVIFNGPTSKNPEVVIPMDAEKTSDRVE